MNRFSRKLSGVSVVRSICLALAFTVMTPLYSAYIGYVYPAGGRQGSRVVLLFGGQGLWQMKNIVVTGGGINAVEVDVIRHRGTVGGTQRRYLCNWIERILSGKDKTPPPKPEDTSSWSKGYYWDILHQLTPDQLEIITRGIYIRRNSLQDSPALRNLVLVTIDIDRNAAPGRREIRLVGNYGITNPLPFYVDKVPEIKEPRFMPPRFKKEIPFIKFPSMVNGQIMPGECDRFLFDARKGEKLVFRLKGRALAPFIGDGVPGHFQPVLEITDTKGKPLAFADDWFFDPDPRLAFKVPANGRYMLNVRDALYRGREDFVYRISAVRGVLKPVPVPPPPAHIPLPLLKAADWQQRMVPGAVLFSGVFTEKDPSFSFKFKAEAGKTLVFESFARRLGSPADTRLMISKDGRTLAVSDDLKGLRIGICYQQADSYIAFKAPESGEYTVTLAEVSGKGSPDHFFYLRAADLLRPAFEVYMTPSGTDVTQGSFNTVTAHVVRRDGFNGEVKLEVLPNPYVRLAGIDTIPAGADQAKVTLEAAVLRKEPFYKSVPLAVDAVCGKQRVRVRGGDEMMQAFAYTHVNPSQEIRVVRKRENDGRQHFPELQYLPKRLTVSPDSPVVLELRHKPLPKNALFVFDIAEVPAGVKCAVQEVDGKYILTITAAKDVKKTAVNMIINAKYTYDQILSKKRTKRRTLTFPLPAIRLEIK